MKQFQTYLEDRMKSLKVSYNEHERLIVDVMRLNIKWFLIQCEPSTVNTTYEYIQCTIDEMREKIKYLLSDFQKSTIKEKKEELNLKQAPHKVMTNSCVRLQDELLQLHLAIQKVLGKPELYFIARKKCQEKVQHSDTLLKENFPNHVFTVNGKYVHNVESDSLNSCQIEAICALPDGQVLVADHNNKNVKLLNQQYQVVSHWDVSGYIEDMCMIKPSEVAVTVTSNTTGSNIHEVQFITATQVGSLRYPLPG
ncbi:hypothetical protein DPMN_175051 [Dreissena polymorpha]|uniref:Uncharacterized protein n=1 Tax=Dreissena polymorpha TaxID=45954 RepID=A0A9D4E6I0_DREPO|nr:hypothetical protein DPMN_175051 [Dreissena polymorpha]